MWRVILGSLCLAVCVGLIGCTKTDPDKDKKKKVDPAVAEKAKKDLKEALDDKTFAGGKEDKVIYTFKKDGDFEYKGGDLGLKGKWQAVDGKTVEMTFKLSKEEAEKLKPAADAAKALVDLANTAGELLAKAPGATAWTKIEAPTFKEGENTWKESVEVTGDTAKISGTSYKKKAP